MDSNYVSSTSVISIYLQVFGTVGIEKKDSFLIVVNVPQIGSF